MTNENPSRSSSLADVLEVIARAGLTERRRADLSSAIRTVGRALNRPLEQVSAESKLLRRRLNDLSPAAAGVSEGRWANVRSHLRTALALAKLNTVHRTRQPMSQGWSDLFAQLPSKSARMRLTRLFHHLSALGIEPAVITATDLSAFGETLLSDALIKNPESSWREAAWTWNTARRMITGWPNVEVVIPSRKETYTLPNNIFPESFNRDVNAFLARIAGEDLVEELPFRPVRKSTRRTRERQLFAAASALVHRGKNPSSVQSIAHLVELQNYKEILRYFIERRGNTSSSAIEQLAGFLKSVAVHWVRVDAPVLHQMSLVAKRVAVPQQGMTAKNRERLRAFDDVDNVLALIHLPQRLMREADRLQPVRAALLAQTAVAIELLLMRPLRIGNLATLKLDEHLIRPGRKSGCWHVVVPELEVKNRLDLEHELPAESAALIERYLRNFHSQLAQAGNPALFPGKNGLGTKSKNTLAGQISKVIHRYAGIRINPHLFRHFAGMVHLNAHPGEYSVVTHVLGHRSMNTAKKHYTGMEYTAAVRHFDNTITSLRALPAVRLPRKSNRTARRNPRRETM